MLNAGRVPAVIVIPAVTAARITAISLIRAMAADLITGLQAAAGKKPRYGSYVKLTFVDEAERNGKTLPKVVNGELTVSKDDVPNAYGINTEIFVNRNGFRNTEIRVKVPFYAEASHVHVSAQDYLSNTAAQVAQTGAASDIYQITFADYLSQLKPHGAQISVNGTEVNSPVTAVDTKKAEVTIKLLGNRHISDLYMQVRGAKEYILRNSTLDDSNAQKYKFAYDSGTNTLRFSVDPLDRDCDIHTAVKDGAMPDLKKADISVGFGRDYHARFRELRVDNTKQALGAGNSVKLKPGKHVFTLYFREPFRGKIKEVVVTDREHRTNLVRRGALFDVEEQKNGYYYYPGALLIGAELQSDSTIDVVYEDGPDSPAQGRGQGMLQGDQDTSGRDKREERPSPSPNSSDTGSADPDVMKETNNPKDKYPAVFLESPGLLAVNSGMTTEGDMLDVSGFIGYVKDDDEIKDINVYLVDNRGNRVSDPVHLTKDDVTKKAVSRRAGSAAYSGNAYLFSTRLKMAAFNINVKVEVTTRKGETASIVRRTFFDKLAPEVEYEVHDRAPDSDSVRLTVRSTDNSLKLGLYQDDSLIVDEDKTVISFADGGVEVVKEIVVPLKAGQNTITLKATDLANNQTVKRLHVYRTGE